MYGSADAPSDENQKKEGGGDIHNFHELEQGVNKVSDLFPQLACIENYIYIYIYTYFFFQL